MLITILLTIILCLTFWGCCYMSTGGDAKNIMSYAVYPEEVQTYVRNSPELRAQFPLTKALTDGVLLILF